MTEETIAANTFTNSKFLHLLEHNNRICLLHSLTQKKLFGANILKDIFLAFSQPQNEDSVISKLSPKYSIEVLTDTIDNLKRNGMLIKDENEDLEIYILHFRHGLHHYRIQNMYFIPTTFCNLRCKYCFVEDDGRDFTPTNMTQETARKGLEVFAKLTEWAEKISITFYGGEPLLNADIVYFSMRYVRELEKKGVFKSPVELTLLTNGTLVDDRTIEAVLETKTNVSISIDGPENIHNLARKNVEGNGTFDKMLAGHKKLTDAGIIPGVSCTLSCFNVNNIEEVTHFIAEELKPPGMGFNILLPQIKGGNSVDTSHEFAAHQLITAFKILREKGIYEDRVMRRVKPYMESGFHYKDCMGVGGQIIITPEGKIGPCQAILGLEEYFQLSVDDLHSNLQSIS